MILNSTSTLSKKDLESYDYIIVMFSGGKDSIAMVLYLIYLGFAHKLELWHHEVDGREGGTFMDWPATPAFCKAFAAAFNIPIYFSWRVGGFRAEMMKKNARSNPIIFENPDGTFSQVGGKNGKISTRLMYPQVTANLIQRWCSGQLKIDVGSGAINNSPRFIGKRVLVLTGERAEESSARANYKEFEEHRCHTWGPKVKRHVDAWRPVHAWKEADVWEIIERYSVLVHPCYRLGWGRLSCMTCIFGSDSQWASVKKIDPDRFDMLAQLEADFGKTIHRTKSLIERVQNAKPYQDMDPLLILQALSTEYTAPIIVRNWTLPAGAFGENAGPT